MDKEIIHNDWYKQVPVRLVYLHLYLISDEKGEANITIRTLAKDTFLSVQQVRTALQLLTLTQKVTQETTQRITHITLCGKDNCKEIQHKEPHRKQHKKQHKEEDQSIVIANQSDVVLVEDTFLSKMQEDYPHVMKMEKPLQEKEYDKLVAQYGQDSVEDVLMAMDNRKTLLKDYTSAYSTALQWLKKRNPNQSGKSTCLEQNNLLLGQYPNIQGTYGAFLFYISVNFKNIWIALPAPSEDDFLQIMSDTSKRVYLLEILKRMDGDPKSRQYDNFYTAFVKVFEIILNHESTNTKLNRERTERQDALKQHQAESLRRGTESQEPLFGSY